VRGVGALGVKELWMLWGSKPGMNNLKSPRGGDQTKSIWSLMMKSPRGSLGTKSGGRGSWGSS